MTAIAVAGLRTSASSNASAAPPVPIQGPGLYYIVTTTTDDTDFAIDGGTGTSADPFQVSSLRGAVLNANTQITTAVGPITIRVPAGTYNLSVNNPEAPAVFGTTAWPDIEVGSAFNHNTTIIGVGGTPHIVQTVGGNDVITTGFADAFYTPQAVNLTLNNLEISGGTFTGIFTGVDNATGKSDTTIISCNVHNNSNPFGQGGAIFNQTGNLSVQDSTFSNNSAGFQAGAIFYDLPNAVGPGSTGNFTVSNSEFISNTATGAGGFPGGGAILLSVAGTGNTISITNSNFENNTTGGDTGGAIEILGNNPVSVNLNRFFGNTSGVSGNALSNSGTTTIDAINNWWGCDDVPGASGCQTVSGAAISDPRIDLVLTSDPASACHNSTTTLTADFTKNSAGAPISPTSLDGELVSFALVGGPAGSSVSPATAIISGAMATSTFTAGANSGTATVSAAFDNGVEEATIEVNANTTATDPADQTVCQGATATFSTSATGSNLEYAWTLDGSPFGGDTSSIMVDTTSLSLGAHTIGLTVTGTCGTVVHSATLTVAQDIAATDPADQTVCQGATASFSTTASGTGPFTYAWTLDGSPFGGNTSSINVPTGSLSLGAHTVEVTVSGACGSTMQSATLTVQENASTTDPVDQTVCEGATANFSTTASGVGPFTYAWTVDGSPAGTNSPNLAVNTTGFTAGNHTVSVTVTAAACGSATQSATLTVNANTTASDPADTTVCEGAMANFSTTATGTNLSFAWTVDGSPAGGNSPNLAVDTTGFSAGNHSIGLTVSGACGTVNHTASLTVNANTVASDPADATVCQGAMANFSTTASGTDIHYAWTVDGSPSGGDSPNLAVDTTSLTAANHTIGLTVTGTCGTVTHSATLTVHAPAATTDPADQAVCQGQTATFTTTASGTGPFSFVWKKGLVVLMNGDLGGRVTINSTATTSTLTITNAQPTDAGSYTVETTGGGVCNNTAIQSANLAVNSGPPVITTNGQTYTLWPPNHKYSTFTINQFVTGATDACGSAININDVVIASVTSDELEDNPGGADGNTLNDIVIAADCKTVQLRAERDGNLDGRVYTLIFQVVDSQGNVGTATGKVYVPKNNNGTAVDSGVKYAETCP